MPRHECRWIESIDELEQFRDAWRSLWIRDPHATPMQSPEWLLPWWRSFGEGNLRTVAVYKRDELMALLPFYIYPDPVSGQRKLLLLGVGTSDYLDCLFAPECTSDNINAALQKLLDRDGWDLLAASQLRPNSRLLCAIKELGLGSEFFDTEICSRTPAVPISALPSKLRQNATYYRRRAERAGSLDYMIAGRDDLNELFDALVQLHTLRWQSEGEPGVFADPRVVQWHRDALPLLHDAGLLHFCALKLNGEIAAVAYSLVDPSTRPYRCLYFYLTAYSIQHADHRPGTVLFALAFEHAATQGIETIDMLRGNEAYKQMWHTVPSPTYGFSIQRETMLAKQTEIAA